MKRTLPADVSPHAEVNGGLHRVDETPTWPALLSSGLCVVVVWYTAMWNVNACAETRRVLDLRPEEEGFMRVRVFSFHFSTSGFALWVSRIIHHRWMSRLGAWVCEHCESMI